jgi:hypothetical protein
MLKAEQLASPFGLYGFEQMPRPARNNNYHSRTQ